MELLEDELNLTKNPENIALLNKLRYFNQSAESLDNNMA
jgi:hypothetical protein